MTRRGTTSSGRLDVLTGLEAAEALSVDMLARHWKCRYCGAEPFEPCHRRGRAWDVLRSTHPERLRVIQAVMQREYTRGVAVGLRLAAAGDSGLEGSE